MVSQIGFDSIISYSSCNFASVECGHLHIQDDQNRATYIALTAIPGVGRKTLEYLEAYLVKHNLNYQEAWPQLKTLLPRVSPRIPRQGIVDAVIAFQHRYTPENYLESLAEKKIWVALPDEASYPPLLRHTTDHPALLYVRGPLHLLQDDVPIAVVGTRRPTGYGEAVTRKITRELTEYQTTIISGFMYGIDTVAHRTALDFGGQTIGVLGYGFDHIYPSSHREFFKEFLNAGQTLITEYPPDVGPRKGLFRMRNRIVAGLSYAVVIPEATIDSGTRITVRAALDYNRCVCAVPGPITSQYSDGTRWFLNQGAVLVGNGKDVIEEVRGQLTASAHATKLTTKSFPPPNLDGISPLEHHLYTTLLLRQLSSEELGESLHRSPSDILVALSMMELRGLVVRRGAYWNVAQI